MWNKVKNIFTSSSEPKKEPKITKCYSLSCHFFGTVEEVEKHELEKHS